MPNFNTITVDGFVFAMIICLSRPENIKSGLLRSHLSADCSCSCRNDYEKVSHCFYLNVKILTKDLYVYFANLQRKSALTCDYLITNSF